MKIILHVEDGKDATGKKKKVMWVTLKTAIKGLESFSAVSELPKDSVLCREIDDLTAQMLEAKNAEIKSLKKSKKTKK
jgi:hypothetical protein